MSLGAIKERNEKRIRSGDPDTQKSGIQTAKLQNTIYETAKYINSAAKSFAPEMEHNDEELQNLSVLWGEYLHQNVGPDRLQRWIENAPLAIAVGYTVAVEAPKVSALTRRINRQTEKDDGN